MKIMNEKKVSLVPFGKYANQPVEVLQNDPDYVQWLQRQPWFQERYPAIFNIVINKFGDEEETPEHNRIQAMFLDREFRLKTFAAYLDQKYSGITREAVVKKWNRYLEDRKPETQEKVVEPQIEITDEMSVLEQIKARMENARREVMTESKNEESGNQESSVVTEWKKRGSLIVVSDPLFEIKSVDVQFNGWFLERMFWLKIEIKPVVSDNYPAILRQMRNNDSSILIFDSFDSAVISESTMIQFFRSQGIEVISLNQINHSFISKFSLEMNE